MAEQETNESISSLKRPISITGYVVGVGNVGLGMKGMDSRFVGLIIECDGRDIQITGLTKDEARVCADLVGRLVTLKIERSAEP